MYTLQNKSIYDLVLRLKCTALIMTRTFSTREGWWYIGIKGDGGIKSKGTRLLTEKEK